MQINLTKWFNFFFVSALLWLLLEGVFRKWLIPSLATPLFAIKYVLFGLTYLTYFITKPYMPNIRYFFQLILVVFAIYTILHSIYNPLKVSILVTVFGYINYFFFVPLVLMVPAYFNSFSKIESFIKWLTILSLPIFILGIMQYYLPPDDILNKLVNEEQKFANVATYTRSLSIFTFVKIYNVYLLFTLSLIVSYIFIRLRKNMTIWFYTLILFLGILNLFMTGSRLPTGIFVLFFIVIIFFSFLNIPQMRKTVIVTFLSGIILSGALYVFSSTFNTAIDAFFQRSVMIETVAEKGREGYSSTDRIIERITAFKYSKEAGWFGFGIGTTYQGTGMTLAKHRNDVPFEEEGERIVLELGIIGGILVLLLRLSIVLFSIFYLSHTKNIDYFLLLLPLTLLIAPPLLFLNETTFNYLDNFSYWFTFGLILSLVKIIQNNKQSSESTVYK